MLEVAEKHAGLSNQNAAEFIDILPPSQQILSLRLKRPSVDEETFLFDALGNFENIKISNTDNYSDHIDKERKQTARRKASTGSLGRINIDSLPDDLKLHMMEFFSIPSIGSFSRLSKSWYRLTQKSQLWKSICVREFGESILPERFKSWKEMCQEFSIPLEKDPNFRQCCYGHLGEHRAVTKLQSKPPGTFLFRSSSTEPNALTVSYVGFDKLVKHRRLHKISQGYTFKLPGYKWESPEQLRSPLYKTYSQLLRLNCQWLMHPLTSDPRDVMKSFYFSQGSKIDIHCPDNAGPPSSAVIHHIAEIIKSNKTDARELLVRANVYYGYKIGNTDLMGLLDALIENTSVMTLTIAHMQFDSTISSVLANLIRYGALKCLRLHHCVIVDAKTIVEALQSSGNCKLLYLNERTFVQSQFHFVSALDFSEFKCVPWQCANASFF